MQTETPDTPVRLLTANQSAELLSISPRKLWSLTASGEISHIRIGRAVRYSVVDLLDYVEANREGEPK